MAWSLINTWFSLPPHVLFLQSLPYISIFNLFLLLFCNLITPFIAQSCQHIAHQHTSMHIYTHTNKHPQGYGWRQLVFKNLSAALFLSKSAVRGTSPVPQHKLTGVTACPHWPWILLTQTLLCKIKKYVSLSASNMISHSVWKVRGTSCKTLWEEAPETFPSNFISPQPV